MDASDSIFNVSSLLDSSKDGDTDPDKSSSPKSISISKSMSKVACMLRNNNRRRSNSFLLEESGKKAFEEEETLDFDDCEIVVEEDSLSYDYKQEMNTVIEEAAAKLIHNNEVTGQAWRKRTGKLMKLKSDIDNIFIHISHWFHIDPTNTAS